MKAKSILFLSLAVLFFSGCARETIHYHGYSSADLVFDYWSGPSGTIIEGEIYNDGDNYIGSVELEVKLYDHGSLVKRDRFWIDTYIDPNDFSYFTLDLAEEFIDDVAIRILTYN